MLISEITQYNYSELFTFVLVESADNWEVVQSSAFKKGFKKYQNDKKVMDAYKKMLNFIKNQDGKPKLDDYPIEFNVHPIKVDKRFAQGAMTSHLKGQKIIMIFRTNHEEEKNQLQLIHMGTHQDVGWR